MNVNRSNKRKWLLIKKDKKQYSAETMTDADYTDDLIHFTNAPTQAESLLLGLEQAAENIECK